jgi:protein O-GlcNAc transferase
MLLQDGEVEKAIGHYQEAVRRNPRSAEAHNWLGLAYSQQKNFLDAIAEFRQAVSLKSDFSRAYVNLGSRFARSRPSS